MAHEKTPELTPEQKWQIWEDSGIIDPLFAHIATFYPGIFETETDISFGTVTWTPDRGSWIGVMNDGLECRPVSVRWAVDPTVRPYVMVFQVNNACYAVPIGLAPTSFRVKAENGFKQAGVLEGRMPGLRKGEWNTDERPQVSLQFQRNSGGRDDLVSWTLGKAAFLVGDSPRPKPDKDVICEIVNERLNSVEVRWLGVTVGQFEAAERESERLAGTSVTGRRRALPEIGDPVAAMGLEIEQLSGGRIDGAFRRLCRLPETEEQAVENPLALAMGQIGLPFRAEEAWATLYRRHLDKVKKGAVAVLKDKRNKERSYNHTFGPSADSVPHHLKTWTSLGLDSQSATLEQIDEAVARLDAVTGEWDNDSVVKAMFEVEVPFNPEGDGPEVRMLVIRLVAERLKEALRKRAEKAAEDEPSNGGSTPALPEAAGNWDEGTDRPEDTTSGTGTEEPASTDTSEDQPAT